MIAILGFSATASGQDYALAETSSSSPSNIVELGLGLNSFSSGRLVPVLSGAYNWGRYAITASTTGASTGYYYYAAYSAGFYRTWTAGTFITGKLEAGLGGGVFYTQRDFLDEGVTRSQASSDFGLGPSFRVKWVVFDPLFVNMEVLWGLRDLSAHLTLNAQDVVNFSIGAQF